MSLNFNGFFGAQLNDEPQEIDLDAPKKSKMKKSPLMRFSDKAASLNISNEFCLVSELHTLMGGYDADRPYTRLHASDVTDQENEFCPRERGLLITTKAERNKRFISTETRTYFDVGEAYHDLIREKWGLRVSLGNWKCLSCDHIHEAMKKPNSCHNCGRHYFEYQEQRVRSKTTAISCGIDWQIDSPKLKQPTIVEIKSMAADEFKKLVAPFAEHRIRTKLYLYALNDAAHPEKVEHLNKDNAIIVYVSKGAPVEEEGESYVCGAGFEEKKTPFKVFLIERDDGEIQPYLDKGIELKKYLNGGKLPERICKTPKDPRATNCKMCDLCWRKT